MIQIIRLQYPTNAVMVHCLEASIATTIAFIVKSAFAKEIEALIFAGVSISVYSQRAVTFSCRMWCC